MAVDQRKGRAEYPVRREPSRPKTTLIFKRGRGCPTPTPLLEACVPSRAYFERSRLASAGHREGKHLVPGHRAPALGQPGVPPPCRPGFPSLPKTVTAVLTRRVLTMGRWMLTPAALRPAFSPARAWTSGPSVSGQCETRKLSKPALESRWYPLSQLSHG